MHSGGGGGGVAGAAAPVLPANRDNKPVAISIHSDTSGAQRCNYKGGNNGHQPKMQRK